MGKTIISPVDRFPGAITIPDWLTIPQAQAWETALREVETMRKGDANLADVEYLVAWWSGISAVVEAWDLQGFSHDPLQTTPRGAVIQLFGWIIDAITGLYMDASDIPNG